MPFLTLTEPELRDAAKRHIETLEFWLRRIVHEVLTQAYGVNYFEHQFAEGPWLIKRDIRDRVTARITAAPSGRFTRWIDATLIEHVLDIICNASLYEGHFKSYFSQNFPANMPTAASRDYLKFILERCSSIRNILYHANPVSVRNVEQVVCYTNDIIDSIKAYYIQINSDMDFNAPSIISFSDSTGFKVYTADLRGNRIDYRTRIKFRPGDRIKFAIEVDASFEANDYSITWIKLLGGEVLGVGNEVIVQFDESWVSELNGVRVFVKSNKAWHRHGQYDDDLKAILTILPPAT